MSGEIGVGFRVYPKPYSLGTRVWGLGPRDSSGP